MKISLLIIACFLIAQTAVAFNPAVIDPELPYDIIPTAEDSYVKQEYLGTLEGYPEMFELVSDANFDLNVQLKQRVSDAPIPFNIVIVRKDEESGGVVDVARLNQPVTEWTVVPQKNLAIDLLESRLISLSLPPGTYRIEVGTPDNIGDYMLVIGDEETRAGYFKTTFGIIRTQLHFGYTIFHALLSSYVYYPLGILILIGAFWFVRKKRKQLEYGS